MFIIIDFSQLIIQNKRGRKGTSPKHDPQHGTAWQMAGPALAQTHSRTAVWCKKYTLSSSPRDNYRKTEVKIIHAVELIHIITMVAE